MEDAETRMTTVASKASSSDEGGPRRTTRRMTRLLRLLLTILTPDASRPAALALRFGVTEGTIRRDVAQLREATGLELRWQRRLGTWRVGGSLTTIMLEPPEASALLAMLVRAASRSDGMTRTLAMQLISRLAPAAPDHVRQTLLPAGSTGELVDRLAHFRMICDAIERGAQVELTYFSRARRGRHRALFFPHRILEAHEHFYVEGFRVDAGQKRKHRLDRILAVAATPVSGNRMLHLGGPQGADRHRVGVFDSDPLTEVTVRIDRHIADLVHDEPPNQDWDWEPQHDGSVVAKYRVTGIDALIRWALKWADGLVILAPEGIRKKMRQHLARSLSRHRQVAHAQPDISPLQRRRTEIHGQSQSR